MVLWSDVDLCCCLACQPQPYVLIGEGIRRRAVSGKFHSDPICFSDPLITYQKVDKTRARRRKAEKGGVPFQPVIAMQISLAIAKDEEVP
jgi:hypothetical protein